MNFWTGAFDSANSAVFLPWAFGEAFGSVETTDDPASADVVVSSLFGDRPTPRSKTIQFIGENIRPNMSRYRYALSFDYDSYGGRNFRLPLWWWRLDWPGYDVRWRARPVQRHGINHGFEDLIPIDALLRPRSGGGSLDERRFCVLISSNPEPLRVNLYVSLRLVGEVTGYGAMFNEPLLGSKFDVLSAYRFCLCSENGIYPGYHTEKLVDAWYGGCVPLYSGDRLLHRDFNPAALVNYQDHLDMLSFVKEVDRLNRDPAALLGIYSQPLLLRRPTLDGLVAFLREAVAAIRRDGAS